MCVCTDRCSVDVKVDTQGRGLDEDVVDLLRYWLLKLKLSFSYYSML